MGLEFEEALQERLEAIASYAEAFAIRVDTTREAVVKRFPYIILFTIAYEEGAVTVTGIFHTSQDPLKKSRR